MNKMKQEKMITAYDKYGDFNRNLYYSTVFTALPSHVKLKLSLKASKENMEKVIDLLDLDKYKLEIIFKNWNTLDYKNSKIAEDFADEYLYKSEISNLVVYVSLEVGELFIDFLYCPSDQLIEQWILETNHKIRATFGATKTPSFNVLARKNGKFYVEKINTKNFETLEIKSLYNDDFQPINELIVNSISERKSGLILLHGKPGTGKTTYIKNLIATFKNDQFIFIQNDFVVELLKPEFIAFLLRNKNCILVIEDAEKVVVSRESEDRSVVSTILQLTDGLFSDYLNIKVICSFNTDLNKIDKALLRKGRMIARYEFNELRKEKANQILIKMGHEALDKEMTLAEIYKLRDANFSTLSKRRIGFN